MAVPLPEKTVEVQTASPTVDHEYDLRDVVKVLRRRRGIIVATVLVLTAAAGLVAMTLTPRYTAVSTIIVEPRDIRIVDFDEPFQEVPQDTSMINTHVKLITSNSFVHRVIDTLDLLEEPEFNHALRDEPAANGGYGIGSADRFDSFAGFVSEALSWAKVPLIAVGLADQGSSSARDRLAALDTGKTTDQGPRSGRAGDGSAAVEVPEADHRPTQHPVAPSARLLPDDLMKADQALQEIVETGAAGAEDTVPLPEEEEHQTPPVAENGREVLMAAATELFLERLEVGLSGQSYAISIAFTSTEPQVAARVANTVAESYVEHQLQSKHEATGGALDWLAGRLNELRSQLVQTEQAAEAYRADNELMATDRRLAFGEQELAALNQELIRSRTERIVTEAKLRRIRQLRNSGKELDAVPEVMMSPIIANIRQQQMQLAREEAQLRQEYGPRHPKVTELQADKDKLEGRLEAEIANIIGGLENEIAIIEVREQTLQANLERAKAASVQNNRAEIELRFLDREAQSTRALYETFLNRFKELSEQREMLKPGVRVVSTAAVPAAPSFPQVELVTGAGFMGSLMFATLLAFVVDRLDRGIRTGRQAEEVLDVPHIGFVPKFGGSVRGQGLPRYLADKPTSAYAEAIRTVQTALYFSNVDRPPQVVLVTSSVPAEGKTTLALSLASLLARSGRKTVAVDLDLRRPTLGSGLRSGDRGDLVDFMWGEKTLDEILHEVSDLNTLNVIPARRLTASPTDLLTSQRMTSLMTDLRERYEYVVLDSPPLLGMSDSRFAARLADAVVFVVRWSKTNEEVASKGLKILRDGGAPVAGAVLTRVNVRRHRKYSPQDVAHHHRHYKRYYVN